ncbi:MGMT family protein [Paenibacillus harenae]|uniref:Methylated-DNA-protein-cysteine methyltransferase-like protein n=1 Tax=Paenibacillus harenae TaxID=306543 RepID=A0ABT9U180_PAEHA|nr:MGMT family protein [Paenibacillus harenae]MDQ0113387.1 methylated-DNA-protein-cysteine methyltransferase-like protein [Paenibacillus harenae]
MQPFTQRVIDIIKHIPEGRVMTYGQVAEQAGSRRGARQVVRILHAMSNAHKLPWHRVVNAKGEVAIPDDEGRFLQMMHLQGEGIEVSESGKLDLERYRHSPPAWEEERF